MYRAIQRSTRFVLPASLAAATLLGGCTSMQEPTYPPTKGAVLGDNNPRTVEYPGGRYQLYGEGTTASPYYWVWIPTGSTPTAPPPLPPSRVASSTATQGRYQLYGEGTTAAPYYWVWVPAGTTVVPPQKRKHRHR